jgi:hypothetical protein
MADIYSITGQKQNVQINPSGNGFDDVWEVTYKVTDGPSKGTNGMITVTEDDHNAKYVDAAIREKITALHSVASL